MGIRGEFEKAVGVIVGRHVLNHLGYLLGSDGEPKIFETEEKAKECLKKYGGWRKRCIILCLNK